MEKNNGLSPEFPAGLRVLVVDDDPTWIKILVKMLKRCSYEVTSCCLAKEALTLLRERKDDFDIVISDVNMPDMDGFKLLEHIGLEMELPVIMMSVDGETPRVMKGVQHGACDYLLKPVRMKELRNIWQHVYRKKREEMKDNEFFAKFDSSPILRSMLESSDNDYVISEGEPMLIKTQKDAKSDDDNEQNICQATSAKKPRVVWCVDLHKKFVNAVNQIGIEKVGPKKILDLMHVPTLTRENIASHLQKYRLYLRRIQRKNKHESFVGGTTKKKSCSSPESLSTFTHFSPMISQQASSPPNFGYLDERTNFDRLVQGHHDDSSMHVYLPVMKNWPLTNGHCEIAEAKQPLNVNHLSYEGVLNNTDTPFVKMNTPLPLPEIKDFPVSQFPPHQQQQQHISNISGNPFPILQNDYPSLLVETPPRSSFQHMDHDHPVILYERTSLAETNTAAATTINDEIQLRECTTAHMPGNECASVSGNSDQLFSVRQMNHELPSPQVLPATSISSMPSEDLFELSQMGTTTSLWESQYMHGMPVEDPLGNLLQVSPFQGYDCFDDFDPNSLNVFKCNESKFNSEQLNSYLLDGSRSYAVDTLLDSLNSIASDGSLLDVVAGPCHHRTSTGNCIC